MFNRLQDYSVIMADRKQTDLLRVIDVDGQRIFRNFPLNAFGSPLYHEEPATERKVGLAREFAGSPHWRRQDMEEKVPHRFAALHVGSLDSFFALREGIFAVPQTPFSFPDSSLPTVCSVAEDFLDNLCLLRCSRGNCSLHSESFMTWSQMVRQVLFSMSPRCCAPSHERCKAECDIASR